MPQEPGIPVSVEGRDPVKYLLTEGGLADQRIEAKAGDHPTWLVKALSYVGTREIADPRGNVTITGWAKKLGGNIARAYDHDQIPWCALFANAVLREDGKRGPVVCGRSISPSGDDVCKAQPSVPLRR